MIRQPLGAQWGNRSTLRAQTIEDDQTGMLRMPAEERPPVPDGRPNGRPVVDNFKGDGQYLPEAVLQELPIGFGGSFCLKLVLAGSANPVSILRKGHQKYPMLEHAFQERSFRFDEEHLSLVTAVRQVTEPGVEAGPPTLAKDDGVVRHRDFLIIWME
jgi:hypothetical protein